MRFDYLMRISDSLIAMTAVPPGRFVERALNDCYRQLGEKVIEAIRKNGGAANVRLESSVEWNPALFAQEVRATAFVS